MKATDTRGLISLALELLEPMQLLSGLFCHEVVAGDSSPRGRSLRYSLMVYLGLLKAEQAGYEHGVDAGRLRAALLAELGSPELRPGDLGLYLWADGRAGLGRGAEISTLLRRALQAEGGLGAREGMEVAWIVQGLALQPDVGAGDGLLDEALDRLVRGNVAPTGLLYHRGDGGLRRRFPNFATEIYAVLALATAGRLGLDERALPAARRLADRLIALQRDDGGWPWLYDAERGTVVEPYEIYAVHQDAMAPMGLLELAEATGDRRYRDACLFGLEWMDGRNDLGRSVIDVERRIVYRSIRRKRPSDRLLLYANTAASALVGRPLTGSSLGALELNPTDRPYHLGWVLEAWCGREGVGTR